MLFVWMIIYGCVFLLEKLPLPHGVFPACTAAFAALLLWWCLSREKQRLGLVRPVLSGRDCIWNMGVLLALPVWQAIVLGSFAVSAFFPVFAAVLAEELFFRGFLPNYLGCKSVLRGAVGSAILFAALHSVNLAAGWDGAYVAVQIVVAFSAGLYWAFIRWRYRSVIPSVVAHLLVNLTGTAAGANDLSRLLPGLCICCLLMLGSSVKLYRRIDGGVYEAIY